MPLLQENSIVVRQARPHDAQALVALQRGIYLEGRWFVGDGPMAPEALERKLRRLDPQMELYLVVAPAVPKSQAELWGWLELNRFGMSRMRHIAVLTLAIAKEQRRQGLGSKLLERAYGWAKQVGVEKIQLNVRAENHAAIALYEKEGFIVEGREARQIREGERYEDNFLMAKFL